MERIDCEQGSREWIQARLGIPTVSEFYRFITPAKGNLSEQATGYVADLITEAQEGPNEHFQSRWMQRGSMLEGDAIDWYAFRYDCEPERCGLILNKGAGWSPDSLIGEAGALEVKCPKPSTHVKWLLNGGLPTKHKPQCHGALIVGEREWIDFLSYCPGYKPLLVRIASDDYTAKVGAAMTEFLLAYKEARDKVLS